MSKNLRIFIAIKIPGIVAKQIIRTSEPLRKIKDRVKWVEPENFHLTLKFLGDTPQDRLEPICDALCAATKNTGKFDVTFGGAGAFPGPRRPKVLWIGVNQGGHQMIRMAESVDQALETLGFTREKRPFSPHLTIGRYKDRRGGGNLTEPLQAMAEFTTDIFTCDKIHLIKSVLTPKGPIYTTLESFTL